MLRILTKTLFNDKLIKSVSEKGRSHGDRPFFVRHARRV
uniref:Uncharacterized protein n=1 Tax=Microviridae sp. ctXu97 TaxID=2825000 RepID=A0A8S5V9I8_9VIRU|nr:MAG TPA: hypothetical protein [Microviridae sp. ctXu97]